jgi:pimeloyl-ACP methyl ester carboxylesterase
VLLHSRIVDVTGWLIVQTQNPVDLPRRVCDTTRVRSFPFLRQSLCALFARAAAFAVAGVVVVGSATACVTPGAHATAAPSLAGEGEGVTFVDVGDAWLRVRDRGPKDSSSTKTPLVLLHGFGSRLETWRAVQDALAVDRRVIAFDHKGFGHSERSDGDYGPEKHARDVLAVLDALGVQRAVIAGHSYGGGVALRVALRAPGRVAGLGLVDAFALQEQVPTSFAWAKAPGLGEFIFTTLFVELPGEKYVLAFHDGQRFATAEVLDEVRALQQRPGSTFAELMTVRGMDYAHVQADYGRATANVPRVVVWGESDRVTPLVQGKKLAALLDAPLVVVPACGHVPSWERPSVVQDALRGVLAAADRAVPPSTPPTTPGSSASTSPSPTAPLPSSEPR